MEEIKWSEKISRSTPGGFYTVKGPTTKCGNFYRTPETTYYCQGSYSEWNVDHPVKKLVPDSYKWLETSLNPNTSTSGCTIA